MFERFDINEDTILIGHSCGGGFILRYLSENDVKVGKVVLVAPWIDPDDYLKNGMFKFKIDPDLASKTRGIVMICSTDDMEEVVKSVKIIRDIVKGIKVNEHTDKGHFCFKDLKTNEFPELLQEALA